MKFFLFISWLFLHWHASGQMVVPQQIRAENNLDRIDIRGLSTGDFMLGIPPETGKAAGIAYLDEKWHTVNLNLYDGNRILKGYPVKYNLKDQVLEVNTQSGIRVASIEKIKSFTWFDSLEARPRIFVNARDYHCGEATVKGFLELLAEGSISLFKFTWVTVKKADYVPALAMGSLDEKLIRLDAFYYGHDSVLIKVKNQKLLLKEFGSQGEIMLSFIKSNSLDIKKQEELIKVINKYNGLMGTDVK